MLINLKKINVNVVIGILLILLIIYILYNKKQEVFTVNYPNLTSIPGLEVQLIEVVLSCFKELEEPKSLKQVLKKEFIDLYAPEVYGKLEELILPELDLGIRIMRIFIMDYSCGNSDETQGDAYILYFLKTIKSLMSVYREIYEISSEPTTLEPLIYDDLELLNQFLCIVKKNLLFDDPKISSKPIILTDESTYVADPTSSSYTCSIQLLEFITKFVKGQSTDQCLNIDINQKSNILSTYIDLLGIEKKCNGPETSPPPPSNGSETSPPPPTTVQTNPPPPSSRVTVTGYDSSVASNYSNVTPVPNNLPRGINLTNSQGPNNFFLPNIRIS
jgi:hypothetical protein